MTVRKFINHIV